MQLEHVVIQMLDISNDIVLGMKEETGEAQLKFLSGKFSKLFTSSKRKKAYFEPTSSFLSQIRNYKMDALSFQEMVLWIGEHLSQVKKEIDQFETTILLLGEVVEDGRRYIVGINQAFHSVMAPRYDGEQDQIVLEEVSVLSANLLKNDFAFLVELSDESVSIIEEKTEVQGTYKEILSMRFLEASANASLPEATKIMQQVGKTMSEKYDLDTLETLPKMKQMVKEAVEQHEEIEVAEIAEKLFHEIPYAKDLFVEEVKKAGIGAKIDSEHAKVNKSVQMQKLMADSKIEIILPVEYMNAKDKFEIKKNPDGSIVIQIKNITHLKSK